MTSCSYCQTYNLYRYTYTVSKICESCNHIVSQNATKTCDYKPLAVPKEYCLDLLNTTISLVDIQGTITGRLRYFYNEGYLNKWAFYSDNKCTWLCESMGNYFLLAQSEHGYFADDLKVNDTITQNEVNYTVDAVYNAIGYSMQGELPDFDTNFTTFKSIECSFDNQILIIHENEQNEQVYFTGIDIEFDEIIRNVIAK